MPVTPEQRTQWAELRKQEETLTNQSMKARASGNKEEADALRAQAIDIAKQAKEIVNPKKQKQ
jgi:hypothetical protein